MSLVHVSGYNHVNPTDVSRVEGFPFSLAIVVTMKNGDKLERYVDEKGIDALLEPSSDDPAKWSTRQLRLFTSLRGFPTINAYREQMPGKVCTVNGNSMFVDDETLASVNDLPSLTSLEDAFNIVYRQYCGLFKIA